MTASKERYDAVVVGAGPSGSTAAYYLARAGLDVLLLERGPYPGSKNVGGTGLYTRPLHEMFPNFWQEAPVERLTVDLQYWVLTGESAVAVSFKSRRFADAPYNRFSALRARFDPWLAGRAAGEGAELVVSCKAEELVMQGDRVVGVRVCYPEEREFRAGVVILAEGVNALLARKAGLVPRRHPAHFSLWAKEVLELPASTIEERFNLRPGEGVTIGLVGHPTAGLVGTASLHTYKNAVGINAGATVKDLQAAGMSPHEFLERIKQHPVVEGLLAGGVTREYTAHLIPEGGYDALPQPYHGGVLLVGDAAGLVNGIQGLNLAMASGKFAAEAAVAARLKGDFSARGLELYWHLLNRSYVMHDLRANRRVPAFYAGHPHVFGLYPEILEEVAYRLSLVEPVPKRHKRGVIWKKVTRLQPLWKIVKDALDTLLVMR